MLHVISSFLFEDLFGRKVDLVTPEALSPHIGPHILKEVRRVSITRWVHSIWDVATTKIGNLGQRLRDLLEQIEQRE